MPLIEGKYDNVKVYRPIGSRYAQGEEQVSLLDRKSKQVYISFAIDKAIRAFGEEFGEEPNWDLVVIEVVCATVNVRATVYEIRD